RRAARVDRGAGRRAAGEEAGSLGGRVGHHQGDVRSTAGLDAGSPPGGPEAARERGAYGHRPSSGRPASSSRPSTRLAFWIAWPAAPLTRLSSALVTIALPV